MHVRLSTILAAAALVLSTAFVASPETAAAPDTGTVLPFQTFAAMVTDHVHDLAYVAGGTTGQPSKVAVVDSSGAIVKTFDRLPGAEAVALSSDNSTLFVATTIEGDEAITAIDVSNGDRHNYHVGGSNACHTSLAVVDDRVWFNICMFDTAGDGLGVLDPATGSVVRSHVVNGRTYKLAADTHLPHRLVLAGEIGLFVLDTTDADHPTVVASRGGVSAQGASLTMAPGGDRILVGGSVFRTSDLARVDSYPAESATSSSERADGTVAVGGGSFLGTGKSDLFVYRPGHTVFAQQTDYGPQLDNASSVFLAPEGLGFGTTSLFAVTWPGDYGPHGDPPIIHVSRPDPPADPIGTKDLAVPFAGQLIADPSHSQEFVSTGANGNGLIVLDDRGLVTRVLQHLPGISQMTLSGNTLWMALEGGDALAAMNTSTYAVRKYSLGADSAPEAVAVAAGLVWFSHEGYFQPDAYGPPSLSALDPTTGVVSPRVALFHARELRSSPLHPDSIYGLGGPLPAGFPDFTNTPEIRINVTSSPRPTAAIVAAQDVGADAGEAAETLDRLSLAYTGSNTYYRAADALNLVRRGRANPYWYDSGLALATRDDGLVARGYSGSDLTPDVVMQFGAVGPTWRKVDFPNGIGSVAPEGLAFGSSNLYALLEARSAYHVTRIPAPAIQKLSLTSSDDYYSRGDLYRLVAHVEPRLQAYRPLVSIQARPHGGSVRSVTTDARPDAWGNVTVATTFVRPVTYSAQVHYGAVKASAHLCVNSVIYAIPCR